MLLQAEPNKLGAGGIIPLNLVQHFVLRAMRRLNSRFAGRGWRHTATRCAGPVADPRPVVHQKQNDIIFCTTRYLCRLAVWCATFQPDATIMN